VTFARDQLVRLGITCEMMADGLCATVPTFRPDLRIEEDLIEEILRMGEYGKPVHSERIRSNATSQPNPEAPADRARALLASAGLHEIVSWAFVPRSALAAVSGDGAQKELADGVLVQNPISADYEVMRTTLLPGLADALRRNLARGVSDAWLFEVGRVVRRPAQAGEAPGREDARGWPDHGPTRGVAQTRRAGGLLRSQAGGRGSAARLRTAGRAIPCSGRRVLSAPGDLGHGQHRCRCRAWLSGRTASSDRAPLGHRAARLLLRAGHRAAGFGSGLPARRGATAIPRRDPRCVLLDRHLLVRGCPTGGFLSANEPLLRELAVLEDFRDAKYVPAGKKGMLWTMIYRAADRNLTDAETDAAHARVVKALADLHAIEIR
jgi:phenylalanyl-tRNA synthetase beta chain